MLFISASGTASTSIVTDTAVRVFSVSDIPIMAIHTMQWMASSSKK